MIKLYSALFLLLPLSIINAQIENSYLEFSFGLSVHGSGDLVGYHYGVNYGKELKTKLFWQIGFEGTLHDSPDLPLFYESPDGETIDGSIHNVIAGFQLISGIKYNFVQTNIHQFGLSVLPLLRYQASSLSDVESILFPAVTGLPVPVRTSERFESGRTFAVGAALRLNYNFHIGNKFYFGGLGAFQTDTNGDAIPHFSLVIGKRF